HLCRHYCSRMGRLRRRFGPRDPWNDPGNPTKEQEMAEEMTSDETCPACGQALANAPAHKLDQYKDMKFALDGYLQPGESLHRNTLFDALYAFVPKDPELQVQVYNYEIKPGGFTP